MNQTFTLKMIPGIGFHMDSSGNMLLRYAPQDIGKIVNAFTAALDELKVIEAQPLPEIPPQVVGNLNPVAAIGAATAHAAQHGNIAPLPAGHMIPAVVPPVQLKPAMMPPGHQMPTVQQIIHRPILQGNTAPTIPVDPIASNKVRVTEGFEASDD